MVRSPLHQAFDLGGLAGPAFALQVGQDVDEDIALHQSELRIMRRVAHHCDDRLVRMVEIPVPAMHLRQAGMVAGDPVEHPMPGCDMRIIIRTAQIVGLALLPRGPALPILGGFVEVGKATGS